MSRPPPASRKVPFWNEAAPGRGVPMSLTDQTLGTGPPGNGPSDPVTPPPSPASPGAPASGGPPSNLVTFTLAKVAFASLRPAWSCPLTASPTRMGMAKLEIGCRPNGIQTEPSGE